jgi:hypothetical protein
MFIQSTNNPCTLINYSPRAVSPPTVALETNYNTMVECLFQLAQLTESAGIIFAGLTQAAAETMERITKLSENIHHVTQAQPRAEEILKKSPVETLFTLGRSKWEQREEKDPRYFQRETRPPFVEKRYLTILPPPALAKLDQYCEGGLSSLKMYTNPDFFIEQWIEAEMKRREEALRTRKERKQKKGERKQIKESNSVAPVEIRNKLKVWKFDPLTGEKILVEASTGRQVVGGAPVVESTMSFSTTYVDTIGDAPPLPEDYTTHYYAPEEDLIPPIEYYEPVFTPPALPMSAPPTRFTANPAPAQPQQQTLPHSPNGELSVPEIPPPPPPPPPFNHSGHSQVPSSPPATFQRQPSQKSLAQTPTIPKPVDARSNLLESIRQGIQLKTVATPLTQFQNHQASQPPKNVAAILARRIAIVDSSSEEEEEEEEWI